uniref:U38-Liphistoxin-Lth1a_1 n=1 Tax=Liphistius thaleban TaxID=1905330 RepID=A0A4Q8K476_9ARAC
MVFYQALCSWLILSWISPKASGEKRSYITYDMKSLCESHHDFKINMHHTGTRSTGILAASDYLAESSEQECVALIRPPRGYGVIFNLEDIKLRQGPSLQCRDFIKIYNESSNSKSAPPICKECCRYNKAKQICHGHCGYEEDGRICEEYCGGSNNTVLVGTGRSVAILYHTRCASCTEEKQSVGFRMVFTAYRILSGTDTCDWPSDFRCDNGRCIWTGLMCDGHNNCGDSSDESTSGKAQCGGFAHTVKGAIVATAVLATILLGVVLAYLPKLSLRTFFCQKRKKTSLRLPRRKEVKPSGSRDSGENIPMENLPQIAENSVGETEA